MASILHPSTESHIVPVRPWVTHLRLAQFVLAILVLVFVAVPTHYWGGYDAFGVSLFTAIATFVFIVPYYLVSVSRFPKLYNRWAVLALDIFGVIFWLVSFSLLAAWAAGHYYSYYYDYSYWWIKRDLNLVKRANVYKASRALGATAAALGAVEFVLFVVTLVFFSLGLHKHRIDGYHSTYGSARTHPQTTAPATQTSPNDIPNTEVTAEAKDARHD